MTAMAQYFGRPCREVPLVTSDQGLAQAEQYVSAPAATVAQLVEVSRQVRDDQGVSIDRQPQLTPSWRSVVATLVGLAKQWQLSANEQLHRQGQALADRLNLVAQGFHYQNTVDDLGSELAQALYLHSTSKETTDRALYASISQLQDFYVNQYEYFLKYGLRLQQRDELALSTDRIGTFFHKAMESFVTAVRAGEVPFAKLGTKEY